LNKALEYNNTMEAYITEPESKKFLISTSCLNTSSVENHVNPIK